MAILYSLSFEILCHDYTIFFQPEIHSEDLIFAFLPGIEDINIIWYE